MKRRFRRVKFFSGEIFRNLKIFYFLNGLAIGILFYFYSEDSYEHQLFKGLASNIIVDLPTDISSKNDSILVRSVRMIHHLEKNRESVFNDVRFHGFKAEYLQPVTFDLMTGKGACGSNAYVLGRLLMEFDFPIRFAQMKVNGIYGGHIVLESFVNNKWVVLDALYDLSFVNHSSQRASFEEVKNNWSYYKSQLPANYNQTYNYEDVQYTNWNKIPIIMPMIKKVMQFFYSSEEVNGMSLRVFVLRKFHFLFRVSLVLFLLLHTIRIYIYRDTMFNSFKSWYDRYKENLA